MLLAHGAAHASPWAWQPHFDVWLLIAAVAGSYWYAVTRLGPRRGEVPVSRRQAVLFTLGVLALWVHSEWPMHEIAEKYLFSVHMVQHTGFQLIAAPLLLLGLPTWLFRALLVDPPLVRRVLRVLGRPLVAGLLFNLIVVLGHWPAVVQASLEHHFVHFLVHVVLFASAALMWLPVLNLGRAPELPQLGDAGRMLYLFLQSVLPTVPASFLTFSDGVIYRFYAAAPRAFDLSAIDDQQLAGALMKIYAGSLLWGVIAVIFFRWYSRDQREAAAAQTLRWADVERELAATPAPKEPAS
ncbi:MAG TPA: cytochrome c oxidase assembly protein [Acidimicrobiales bacterium]|jgi:putative membrane protein